MNNIAPTRYLSRNELTEEVLVGWIEQLERGSCRRLKRKDLFAEAEVDMTSQESLLEMLVEDLEYQEGIAMSAIEQFGSQLPIGIQTYYWEVGLEKIGPLRRQKFLAIYLVLETAHSGQGRILFSLKVVKCQNNVFKYWGVIDMDVALKGVKRLLEPNSEELTP